MSVKAKLWLAFGCGVLVALAIASALFLFSGNRNKSVPEQAGIAGHAGATQAALAPPSRAQTALASAEALSIDVKTAAVGRSALTEELSVPVTVVPDESRISHIHTRVSGWIERLHVGNTGELVRAGQPIADIFSQELLASQVEYLAARTMTGPPSAVLESGRARLRFFGMSDSDIRAIERAGKPNRLVTLYAPRSGIVAHRGIAAGTSVDPSTEIAVVLDLSTVWVLAEVPEHAAASVRKGMPAQMTFGAGGAPLSARAEFIDPMLTEATRTLKVRFSVPNTKGELRPGMYGTATFQSPARSALTVARDALVDTGASQYVYVAKPDGMYEPRPVRVGARLKDTVEIVAGLREGEHVVVSGVFLLDSESRLRASGGLGAAHGGHGKSAAPAPPSKAHAAGERGHD